MCLRNLKRRHRRAPYVTGQQTEVTLVTMNTCQVNILIKKNVNLSTHETDFDGDNVTASEDSDADNETDWVMKQKIDRFGINYSVL